MFSFMGFYTPLTTTHWFLQRLVLNIYASPFPNIYQKKMSFDPNIKKGLSRSKGAKITDKFSVARRAIYN